MTRLLGAVIGCGFFAQNHLNGWTEIEGVELVAVCDLDPLKAKAAAESTGARLYTDTGRMLAEEKLDFVDIVTTMESHEALCAQAAESGVAIICQKPFAPDGETVKRILERTEAAGVPIMIHENFRFQTPLLALRAKIEEGAIGTPFFGHIAWRTGFDVIAGQPYLATVERFIILDLGIHLLDVARFLLGDVEEIYARSQHSLPKAAGEAEALMSLRHRSGAISAVSCSYATRVEPDPFPQALVEIEGQEGSLVLRQGYRLELHKAGRITSFDVAPKPRSWTDPRWLLAQESVVHTQQHFIDCLRKRRPFATSGRDNQKTFALVEAAYTSAARGQPEVPST